MTATAAPTATQPPTVAEVLGLVTPRACRLADVPDAGLRRTMAARALADRRSDLALLRVLLVEAYGKAKPLARIEAEDEVLLELSVLAVA